MLRTLGVSAIALLATACSPTRPVGTVSDPTDVPTASPVGTPLVGTADTGVSASSGPSGAVDPDVVSFPVGFDWGVATSAYQVEGAVAEDGRGQSIWDVFATQPKAIFDGSNADIACDHYHRYLEDLDLMQGLGVRSYRFSIAWPRVLPDGRGQVNQRGLDFYRRLLDGLQERQIVPMATLFHWDLPQTLQDQGGWQNRDCASWFADYAGVIFDALGDRVPTWLTINEPKVIAQQGYLDGSMAPGHKDPAAAGAVTHHLGLGHGMAVQAFRASGRPGRIAPCLNLVPCYPADDSGAAQVAAGVADTLRNTIYLDPILRGQYPSLATLPTAFRDGLTGAVRDGDLELISEPVDLVGVNYYGLAIVDGFGKSAVVYPTTSASWQQVYPNGLYEVLMRLATDYGNPVVSVTENGIPDDEGQTDAGQTDAGQTIDDQRRIDFLRGHLLAARRAMADGAKLEGFHAWSLLDNWEWARGFSERWGLVHVDPQTRQRTTKASAHWYAGVVAANALPK